MLEPSPHDVRALSSRNHPGLLVSWHVGVWSKSSTLKRDRVWSHQTGAHRGRHLFSEAALAATLQDVSVKRLSGFRFLRHLADGGAVGEDQPRDTHSPKRIKSSMWFESLPWAKRRIRRSDRRKGQGLCRDLTHFVPRRWRRCW
jgi:hypothetical protein